MKANIVRRKHLITLLIVALLLSVAGFTVFQVRPGNVRASASLIQQVSHDTFTNNTSQHQTQVEPDTLSFGPIVVSAFQSGRFFAGGGSSGISWATSFDAGITWKTGNVPAITVYNGGTYARVSDSVVAYDLAHHTWLISSLAIKTTTDVNNSTVVIVNRSVDGVNWSAPVTISASGPNNNWDKDWIVCDQNPASRFFGRCYAEWDDAANNGQIMMSVSNDGGLSWSAPISPANQSFSALGGQPVVQPNGNVIVPIFGTDLTTGASGIYSYMSTDGGKSWKNLIKIAPALFMDVPGNAAFQYRGGSLPSAEIDASGKVYLAWAGCYFETGCTASVPSVGTDDIVMTTTTDGINWTALQRIPLDPIGSGVEHLTAGLAVDKNTAGSQAHLAVTYYYFPNPNCTTQPCQLFVGFASSTNGGASWSPSQTLAGPTAESWYASTDEGFMTGDYISTSIALNRGVTVVPVAQAPNGQQLNEAMYATSLNIAGGPKPCDTLSSSAAVLSPQKVAPAKHTHTAN
ncbi:MAG TPA: sialidase family protein [Ktedonobacteraceae bacterium]|nr:sialidase family protein [Ktedonobacteraceae bacterium]